MRQRQFLPTVILSVRHSAATVKKTRTRDNEARSRHPGQVSHSLGGIARSLLIAHSDEFDPNLLENDKILLGFLVTQRFVIKISSDDTDPVVCLVFGEKKKRI